MGNNQELFIFINLNLDGIDCVNPPLGILPAPFLDRFLNHASPVPWIRGTFLQPVRA